MIENANASQDILMCLVTCSCSHRNNILSSGQQILLQTGHDQLSRLPLQRVEHGVECGQETVATLATDVVIVISVNTHQTNPSKISQQNILGFDLQACVILESNPLVAQEGVGSSQVFISLQSPVSNTEILTNLNNFVQK